MGTSTKRRNSEKRKEKSRDAARCRRSKESEVFSSLLEQLPIPPSTFNQLDKASIMRVAISHLKIRQIMQQKENVVEEEQHETDKLFSKALEGFVMVISNIGDVIYVSENVVKYIGISQIDMIGTSLYEFTHPCDHDEFGDMIKPPKRRENEDCGERTFFLRMKCTLTTKGRSVNLKSASYKVIKFTGKVTEVSDDLMSKNDEATEENKENTMTSYMIAIGEPIPHPSNIEVPLDNKTFLTRHNMDMKFSFCDERMKELLGYSSDELIGKSMFSYHHALDSPVIDKAYKDLFAKGQTMTGQYRFLAKRGGYVWLFTQGTVIYHSRSQKPQCVVCVHYVISDIVEGSCMLSNVQEKADVEDLDFLPLTFGLSTETVFEPKTEECEDFYFPPDMKRDMLSGSTVDLTHLAPMAGDSCIPLPDPQTHFDIETKFDVPVKKEPNTTLCERKEECQFSATPSPVTMSPILTPPEDYLTSMSAEDIDAMNKFFTEIDTTNQLMSDCGAGHIDDADIAMRAPYIPMDSDNDFQLLPPSTEDLFSFGGDLDPGLYGKTETVFTTKDKLIPDPPPKIKVSLRDMLEGSTMYASMERPPDTFNLQMKRPLDKNSMEKGPPAKMGRKTEAAPMKNIDKPCSDSVLLNLLLTGEDRNNGYSVLNLLKQPPTYKPVLDKKENPFVKGFRLPILTKHDCDVNVPNRTGKLLQGQELMRALSIDSQT